MGFEKSVYWNEYLTKIVSKSTKNEYKSFIESILVGVNKLFVFTYLNRKNNIKRFKTRKYYVLKGIIIDYENRLWIYQNQCKSKANDMSRQKELDADLTAIQQIEFVKQLKNIDGINVVGTQYMFILSILEKR